MSIQIGNYTFEGPYFSTNFLENRSGIYAIHDFYNGKYYPIDVGESAQVKTRVKTHDRRDCWIQNSNGTLAYSVYYTPNLQQSGRMRIEQEIRNTYDYPCGQR